MLRNEIKEDPLFSELEDIVANLGMVLCYVRKSMLGTTTQIFVDIMKAEGETGIEDCAAVHNTILPRLEMRFGREDLHVEVSTPGLQRTLRDIYEFSVFKGKTCRVYSLKLCSWVTGIISGTDNNGIELSDFEVEDTKEKGEKIEFSYEDIQKAKLEHRWEDMKNVRVK
ncbi:MAG: ribosome assembly cofactor RimP [Spirochaetales bacterium]